MINVPPFDRCAGGRVHRHYRCVRRKPVRIFEDSTEMAQVPSRFANRPRLFVLLRTAVRGFTCAAGVLSRVASYELDETRTR